MFSFFRKTPIRLHLGEVRVMPRKDFLRHLEGGYFGGRKPDDSWVDVLAQVFDYPPATGTAVPGDDDFAVDIAIEGHRHGGWTDVSGFPVGWRPKVRLSARIHHMKSGKQRAVIRAVECMSWDEFFALSGRWKVQLGLGNPADKLRLRELVQAAGRTLKAKVENAVS